MSILNRARGASLALKGQIKHTTNQLAHTMEHNAKLQAAASSGTASRVEIDSTQVNPFRTHEGEKYTVLEKMRDRVKSGIKVAMDKTIKRQALPGVLAQKAFGGFTKTDGLLRGMLGEMGSALVTLGDLKSNGWKLHRLTEAWAAVTKAFLVTAQAAIRFEAPVVESVAQVHTTQAHLAQTVADLSSVTATNELHRVAESFGVDADFLTALIKTALTLHTEGKLDLAANQAASLSSGQVLQLAAGQEINLSAPLLTFTDGSGATIKMQAGQVHINPVSPASQTAPTAVAPVVLAQADGKPRTVDGQPGYEGFNAHGAATI